MGGSQSFLSSKRPRPEDYTANEEFNEPVKKKLKTTDYIYDRLFQNGENSDISITALGQEWKLHKIYLSQSPYFESMFEGGWKESDEPQIQLNIPDDNITVESLNAIFGSLYRDDILIDSSHSIELMAAASLLQLDSVTNQCIDVMRASLSAQNVVEFLLAAEKYSLSSLEKDSFTWLERNLMFCSSHHSLLQRISPDLMQRLLISPGLFVLQGELDIYTVLKKWLYLRLNPAEPSNANCTSIQLKKVAETYFFDAFTKKNKPFLETVEGVLYLPVFKCLKLTDVLTTPQSITLLKNDKIVPKEVLDKTMVYLWKTLLNVEDDYDNPYDEIKQSMNQALQILCEICLYLFSEPKEIKMDLETFSPASQRCGRILQTDTPHCWRWTGYNFGVDILICYKQRVISIKRNCSSQACPYSVNMKGERLISYRLMLASFSPDRKTKWYFDSGLKSVKLEMDQSVIVARVARSVEFPLTVLLNHIPTIVHEPCCPWNYE